MDISQLATSVLQQQRSMPGLVADGIRLAILRGQFAPGQVLRQEELAKQFGLSRAPIREALRQLEAEGLIVSYPHRGTVVAKFSPEEIEVAGGVYMPGAEELRAIRLHLLENHEEFGRILSARRLRELLGELKGERLSRAPKGFPALHPATGLVRYRQWLLWAMLDPPLATTPKLFEEIVARFRAMAPFIDFLNAPLEQVRRKADPRAFLV